MLDRLLTLLIILIFITALYQVAQWLRRSRLSADLGIDGYKPGRPAILYFTAPGCVPCETIQKPALHSIRVEFDGSVQIFTVDAVDNSTLANRWGVLSVPTTFLIDSQGQPRKINHHAVTSEQIIAQFVDIGESLPGSPTMNSELPGAME